MGKFGPPFKLESLRPEMRAQAERLLAGKADAPAPAAKAPDAKTKRALAVKFEQAWEAANGPAYVPEMTVHPERRFRYDYCWPEAAVALELQGGIHQAGKGHVSAAGFKTDCDKLNLSNLLGITLFKFATGQITAENIVMLKQFIQKRKAQL